jgi:hypothetical protein
MFFLIAAAFLLGCAVVIDLWIFNENSNDKAN